MRNPENFIGMVKQHSVAFGLIGDFIPCHIPGFAQKLVGIMFTQEDGVVKLMIHNNGAIVDFDHASPVIKSIAMISVINTFKNISKLMLEVYTLLEID